MNFKTAKNKLKKMFPDRHVCIGIEWGCYGNIDGSERITVRAYVGESKKDLKDNFWTSEFDSYEEVFHHLSMPNEKTEVGVPDE